MLRALSFAIIAAIGISRLVIGPGWGLLPLLAAGPGRRGSGRRPAVHLGPRVRQPWLFG
jgi:hypothetical protein